MPADWRKLARTPLFIGHRGDSAHATENTLAAFSAARERGADGVELDAQLCASGEIVVFHDDDLRRLAARGERIDALPLRVLREVRLPGGHTIPTLDQALEVLGPDMLVNVELKTTRATRRALVRAVLGEISRHAAAARVLVSSFDPRALALVRTRAPRLAVGYLVHKKLPAPLRSPWPAAALRSFSINPEHDLVTAAAMAKWKRLGLKVVAWSAGGAPEVSQLAALGVDAIIADDPAALRAALSAPRP